MASHRIHLKTLVSLAIVVSLAACSDSSDDEPEPLADPTTETDPGTSKPGTTPGESALATASRIDITRFEQLIANVTTVASDGAFTGENYTAAIAGIAESSESRIVFGHADFLSLLERQVMTGDPSLGFSIVDDMAVADTERGFNREHSCPGGGSLLAKKFEQAEIGEIPGIINVAGKDVVNIGGEFLFNDCQIGDIFIEGSYDSQFFVRASGFEASFRFSELGITGVDGATTTLQNSFSHEIKITDDDTGGPMFNSVTNMNTTSNVALPGGGVVTMEVSVQSQEAAVANDTTVTDVVPADNFDVRIQNAVLSVERYPGVEIIANTVVNLINDAANQDGEPEDSNFSQGNIAYVFSPRSNTMTVETDNGDLSSFNAFINNEDGSTVSFVVPWSSGEFSYGSLGQRMLPSWPITTIE